MRNLEFLHGKEMTSDERIKFIPVIWKQILSEMKLIYKNMKKYEIQFEKEETEVYYFVIFIFTL